MYEFEEMDRLQTLIHEATKMAGSYQPDRALSYVEERMTLAEYRQAQAFLTWVVETGTTFGWNLPQVWRRWQAARKG